MCLLYQTRDLGSHIHSVAHAHHIDLHRGVQSVHLSYPRHFRCRQTKTYAEQRVGQIGQQTYEQDVRLQKGCEAGRYDLSAPGKKAVCKASWNTEHIQASDCYLTQQDAASLDVCKHYLHRAVAYHYDEYEIEQCRSS